MDGLVSSPGGAIRVQTTERGLPLALQFCERAMSKDPAELAREILLVCQISAKRAQLARRRELLARGFSPAVIASLNLSTDDDLARAEERLHGESEDDHPDTWMRPV